MRLPCTEVQCVYIYIYIAVFEFKSLFLNPIYIFTSYCNTRFIINGNTLKCRIVDVIK